LTSEEPPIVARTRKTRKFLVFLREHRHELLEADLQPILAPSYSPEPGGQEPVDAGLLALATLLQAYCPVSDRDAVELTVMDQRWQRVRDGLGAEHPPCSQGPLCHCRRRLLAHHLDKTRRDRTVALAEKTGGFGARQLRAVLDSPLFGAGRVEDTLNLLGHALRKAVGLAAQALGTAAAAVVTAAGLTLGGYRRLTAALERDGGASSARALGLVLEEGARWQHWLAQQHTLAVQQPPLKEVMETITPLRTQDTEPEPEGAPGGRRITQPVTPDRRISIEERARRHGRPSSAKTFQSFQEHCAGELDRTVIREVVVRPANAPEPAAVERLAPTLEQAPGLLQLDIDWGSLASPRLAPWAEQGVYRIARPWPQGGPLCTKPEFTLDFAGLPVPWPGGQTVPMIRGKVAQFPAAACDACALRAQCTTATCGHGRNLSIRADDLLQQTLRAKMQPQRGRAALRKRTAVEHTMAQQLAHQGRRARYQGKAGAKTSVMAGVMQRSATSRSQPIMMRSIDVSPKA
jgi:hypothetical protein